MVGSYGNDILLPFAYFSSTIHNLKTERFARDNILCLTTNNVFVFLFVILLVREWKYHRKNENQLSSFLLKLIMANIVLHWWAD